MTWPLKQQASRVIRRVRERQEEIEVTYRGRVVARLIPVASGRRRTGGAVPVWSGLDRLAAEVGARWPARRTAAEAVREGRREL